jgi:hypothetical protein
MTVFVVTVQGYWIEVTVIGAPERPQALGNAYRRAGIPVQVMGEAKAS